jgi:hypothetical protein
MEEQLAALLNSWLFEHELLLVPPAVRVYNGD